MRLNNTSASPLPLMGEAEILKVKSNHSAEDRDFEQA